MAGRAACMTAKLLFWDTEISHVISQHYGLWNTNIYPDNILHDWFMICGQWRWHGKRKIETVSLLDDMGRFNNNSWDVRNLHIDDYHVVKTLRDTLAQADIVIHHNGDKFDIKKLNARCIYHRIPPVPPIRTVDTLKEARKIAAISSNSLDYLAKYFDLPCRKIKLKPGTMQRAGLGDEKAIKEVVRYGRGDIPPLEGIYDRLLGYMKSHPNLNVYRADGDRFRCPKCGSENLTKDGHSYTNAGKRRKYRCNNCGHHPTDPRTISAGGLR